MKKKRYHNSKTGQRQDKKTGKFLPKFKPPNLGKEDTLAVTSNRDFMTLLAQGLDVPRLLKKVRNEGYRGNWAAVQLMFQALALQGGTQGSEEYDTSKLSEAELRILLALLKKARGENVSLLELLQLLRAGEAELAYLDPIVQEEEVEEIAISEPPPPVIPAPPEKPITRPRPQVDPRQDVLDRAQPSTGARRPNLIGSMSNNAGGYSTLGEDDDFAMRPPELEPKKMRTN